MRSFSFGNLELRQHADHVSNLAELIAKRDDLPRVEEVIRRMVEEPDPVARERLAKDVLGAVAVYGQACVDAAAQLALLTQSFEEVPSDRIRELRKHAANG